MRIAVIVLSVLVIASPHFPVRAQDCTLCGQVLLVRANESNDLSEINVSKINHEWLCSESESTASSMFSRDAGASYGMYNADYSEWKNDFHRQYSKVCGKQEQSSWIKDRDQHSKVDSTPAIEAWRQCMSSCKAGLTGHGRMQGDTVFVINVKWTGPGTLPKILGPSTLPLGYSSDSKKEIKSLFSTNQQLLGGDNIFHVYAPPARPLGIPITLRTDKGILDFWLPPRPTSSAQPIPYPTTYYLASTQVLDRDDVEFGGLASCDPGSIGTTLQAQAAKGNSSFCIGVQVAKGSYRVDVQITPQTMDTRPFEVTSQKGTIVPAPGINYLPTTTGLPAWISAPNLVLLDGTSADKICVYSDYTHGGGALPCVSAIRLKQEP